MNWEFSKSFSGIGGFVSLVRMELITCAVTPNKQYSLRHSSCATAGAHAALKIFRSELNIVKGAQEFVPLSNLPKWTWLGYQTVNHLPSLLFWERKKRLTTFGRHF